MKSLACWAVPLCLWASAAAQSDIADIQSTFDLINNEIIRGTYSARVEVTRSQNNVTSTYTMVEYHDSSIGLHSIDITSSNTRKFFYRNLGAGTVATIDANGTCSVKTIEEAAKEPEAFIYRSNHAIEPEYFLGPSTVVIEMSTDDTTWYSVPDEVRGIEATVYSNYERNDSNTKMIDIWFPEDWVMRRMSKANIPFPIRVLVTENDIIDQFDFYQLEDLSPTEAFRLSDHLLLPFQTEGCLLPKSSENPASLLSTFSFTSVIDGNIAAKEYFSIEDKLYRADTEGSTVIHDDKHGLKYTLGSKCDVQPNPDVNSAIISMGSDNFGAQIVQAYLSLPRKVYVGESFVRGVPVDVWDALPDEKDPSVKRARFFFSKATSVLSANGDKGSQQMLKAMLLDSLDHDETLEVDIYDFAASLGDLDFRKHFNIKNCVEASMYVEFAFKADSMFNIGEFEASNAMNELIEALEENIELSTGVSFLQLPSFKGEVVDGNNIRVIAQILAPPPYLKSFTKRKDMFNHYDGSFRDSSDEEDCAKNCTLSKRPTFLFCGDNQCQVQKSPNVTDWGKATERSPKDCYAYDHVLTSDTMKRETLEEISDTLEKSVLLALWQPFKVSMSDKRVVMLRAVSFVDHLTQFNKQGNLGPYTQQFSGSSIRDEHESSVVVAGDILTVGQCYRECRNNKDIACSSFSICTGKKHCVLTSENINAGTSSDIDQANTIQTATQDCTIYSVNYLSEFERLDGKTLRIGSIENKKGKTAGDCAVICRQQKLDVLEDCRSFNFCPKEGMCFFYRTHYNWDGGNDTLADGGGCDHYALRYSASYTAIGRGAFIGKPATTLAGVSFEECAKQCSERSNGGCKTISYCDSNIVSKPKQTCYMYAADILDLSDSNDKENTCTVYTQLVSYNDDLINPTRQIEKEKESNMLGMGDGALACLLIAMLAIGAVLGAAGWFQREKVLTLIGRSGGSSTSGTTISYNRQDDESRTEA